MSTLRVRVPTFEEYLSGVALANVPFWLYLYVITFPYLIAYSFLSTPILPLLMTMLGGAISGYLVGGRATQDFFNIGLKTGAGAFVLNFMVNLILLQSIVILSPLMGFAVGGSVGGALREKKYKSKGENLQQ